MKKFFLILIAFLSALFSNAQEKENQSLLEKLKWNDEMLNIFLEARVDFQTSMVNGDHENMEFHGNTLKLWAAGEILPGFRYRIRHRLNRSQTPGRDGYSGATDQVWLAFDIKDRWTITAGKQSVQFGTFEYDYDPIDIYLPTMCFDDLDAYKLGVNVAYKFKQQVLNLQVVNSDAPQFASEEYQRKALGFNLLWEGDLLDGLIKTRWAYGAFQHTKSKFYNWLTLGTQFNVNKFTAEVDYYLGNRDMDYGSVVNSDILGSRYVHDQSFSLNLKMDCGKWKPAIKGIWDQRHDQATDRNAYENIGVQTVMEYYPFDGVLKDLRFHLVYQFNSTDYQGIFSQINNRDVHTALAGVSWLFKVK
ncbi:OprO/OprP family phosphate-selective porin [Odoribacter sp. OttesenSCG-928-J03]|nr:OprO/OprP family phosphate-selective porin [Odoribacter sp. OttesenSCG-928-J03]MDL2283408.1 OprO/OprP family phosphate-selective porin [Odoribacter sp. OttesenSCG-928-G04]